MNQNTSEPYSDPFDADAPRIRPYVVTGGKTRSNTPPPSPEAIVSTIVDLLPTSLRFERRDIAVACAREPRSVAELASAFDLPLHVATLLVADLIDEGVVRASKRTDHDIDFIELLIAGIEAL